MLDAFNSDVFNSLSLTLAINKLPFKPNRLGELGLFTFKGIPHTSAMIEEENGILYLIPTQERGVNTVQAPRKKRRARSLRIPHIPLDDQILADDVQGVRVFGSENELETVTSVVNDRLATMRAAHEVTHEYMRAGALQGVVYDADGATVLYNLFTEFDVTETVVEFNFGLGEQDMLLKATAVTRAVEDGLGAATFDHIHALCGDEFFDALVTHPQVREAYSLFKTDFSINLQRKGFEYGGIVWENYRGKVGSTNFIPTDVARFFPVGVPNLFQHIGAPADFTETVNTIGKPVYAKQEAMKFGKGIELHTQSNPLMLCNRPSVLVKGLKVETEG